MSLFASNTKRAPLDVVKVKPIGVTVNSSMALGSGMVDYTVVYAFILQYKDGHRELYHCDASDKFINSVLDKIDM